MNALIPLPRRSLAVWLSALFGPTAYFLLLLLADSFHFPAPPDAFVATLFYLIPLAALLVSESVVWCSSMAVPRKMGWMLLTLIAMLLQIGVLFAIIIVATG
jgi:hypothetical protein